MLDEAVATSSADGASTWRAVSDVTAWPQWTASITEVNGIGDDRTPRLGARFRVKQPGLPALVWKVTELVEGTSFAWAMDSPGLRTVGRHGVEVRTDGTTAITVSIEQVGALAGVVRALMGRRTRRYLQMEVAGLVKASLAAGDSSPHGNTDAD